MSAPSIYIVRLVLILPSGEKDVVTHRVPASGLSGGPLSPWPGDSPWVRLTDTDGQSWAYNRDRVERMNWMKEVTL